MYYRGWREVSKYLLSLVQWLRYRVSQKYLVQSFELSPPKHTNQYMYIATAVHVRVHAQHQWLQNVTCGHYDD